MMYNKTSDNNYLSSARLIGDAFVFAQNHDRKFHDGRLRNSYMCGDIKHWDTTARMPGWWDYIADSWFEDQSCVSTSTGNMAWAGLALTSLFETTNDNQYLNAAKTIADWCIDSTGTNKGFTGGYEGFDNNQTKVTWKSTEHNLDLYALFQRLYQHTTDNKYYNAAINADSLVKSMWDTINQIFWTGTGNDGITINQNVIPLDIQAWYSMAYKDSTSYYSNCINWVNPNCYLSNYNSPYYSQSLNGFDFDTDKDGIWFEGTAQAAIAFTMKNNSNFANSLISNIEYVQTHHNNPHYYNYNNKGIVAADHNNTSTGFNWNYHNRLHIGATSWYVLAKLKGNPYYNYFTQDGVFVNNFYDKLIIYPNPVKEQITVDVQKNFPLKNTVINIYNIDGRQVYKQFVKQEKTTINIGFLQKGIYVIKVTDDKKAMHSKFVKE